MYLKRYTIKRGAKHYVYLRLVEAFRVKSAPSFALAVQWHPEWKVMTNPFSQALFAEFGRAARHRKSS